MQNKGQVRMKIEEGEIKFKSRNLVKYVVVFLILIIFMKRINAGNGYISEESQKKSFTLFSNGNVAPIYFSDEDHIAVSNILDIFTNDIQKITGEEPNIYKGNFPDKERLIIIGSINKSPIIQNLINKGKLDVSNIKGEWETSIIETIDNPYPNVEKALVIAGSDRRGTIYGMFDMSEKMGVSPWHWWADVPVEKKDDIFVKEGRHMVGPPDVKYRGIFLNDEDWGLKPWAEKTFAPNEEPIGPKTYAKIFELMLRLKANYLWPAMHECTNAFNQIPENKQVADSFAIVMGSSHAEPLLFNNVTEWDKESMGEWNYKTNREGVYDVLDERVKNNAEYENIYTVGIRGIHDTEMKGNLTLNQRIDLLGKAINDQREILSRHINKEVENIPQIFVPYKEVLNLYENGLNLPEDITLVWPDDNYGYIKRLSDKQERRRNGGAGVYYHIQYLGLPHSYTWLNTTPPGLIYEEMKKAWKTDARRLWVLNVGDIKPGEYGTEFFLDLAWNVDTVDYKNTNEHLSNWLEDIFGEQKKEELTDIMKDYYHLGFERRPEHMGWGFGWWTKNQDTEYSFENYREAKNRIKEYKNLKSRVKNIYNNIEPELSSSYYELIYYPIVASSLMNETHLYAQKNRWYAQQNRASTMKYAKKSKTAYDSLFTINDKYNSLENSKWANMMSIKQRDEQVYYEMPPLDTISVQAEPEMEILVEQEDAIKANSNYHELPMFNPYYKKSYFIEIYNKGEEKFNWLAKADKSWINLSKNSGEVDSEQRLYVSVDWTKIPEGRDLKGSVTVSSDEKQEKVLVSAFNPVKPKKSELENLFVEDNGYVVIDPENYHRKYDDKKVDIIEMKDFGISGNSMISIPPTADSYNPFRREDTPRLEYDFYTHQAGNFEIIVYTLPTFPLHKNAGTSFGVSVNNDPIVTEEAGVDESFKHNWANNVLRNASINRSTHNINNTGKHTLKIWVDDPGIVVQKIIIDFGGLKKSYMGPSETRID